MTGGIPKYERNLELVTRIDNAKSNGEFLTDIYKEFGISKQRGRQIYLSYKTHIPQDKIDRKLTFKPSHFYIELTESQQELIMSKVQKRLEFIRRYSNNNDLRGSIQETRYLNQKSVEVEG